MTIFLRFFLFSFLFAAAPALAENCRGQDLFAKLSDEKRNAVLQRAAALPHDKGLFWQATRGDTIITIFGTYHFFHRQTDAQTKALLPHGRAADVIYFEMSHEDTKRFEKQSATDPSLMFITSGPTIPEMLEESDWQRLRKRMAERGIPSFMAAKFKPIYLSMMLGLSPCDIRLAATGKKGIDARLARALHEDGKDTRSIEDAGKILRMLDGFSQAEQIAMLKLSLDLPQHPNDLQTTLLEMYLQGETALFWEYGRMLMLDHGGPNAKAEFDTFERLFLTDRNRGWADILDTEVEGKSVFVAVGAGHLPGEIGLLYMLEQRGFTIKKLSLYD